jgi:hypothetical protein
MSDSTGVDPERLRSELDDIKEAMGLRERYPSQFQYWPVFGLLVVLASAGSQVIVLRELQPYLHSVVWFTLLGAAGFYQWWSSDGESNNSTGGMPKPRIGVLWLAVFGLYVVFVFALEPALDELTRPTSETLLFSPIVGLTGGAYLVVGEALRAYRVRRRDRLAFYIGGVWMLVLAVLLVQVEFLHTWGYAAFGIVYGVHAAASYLALR